MSKRILIVVVAAAVVLAGGIPGSSAYGGSTPVNWTVAGSVVNAQFAIPTESGIVNAPGFLVQAVVRGAPGIAQFTVVGFPNAPPDFLPQCTGPGQTFFPNDMVILFADQSMLFAKSTIEGGWICFPLAEGEPVTAVANMTVTGGTGKYEGATGGFVGEFVSQPVGDSGALIAETGTIRGQISW